MKKSLIIIVAVTISFAFSACESIKEQLTVNVDVTGPDVEFSTLSNSGYATVGKASNAPAASQALVILLDKVLELNVAAELQKQGLSVDNIKAFLLFQSQIDVVPGQFTDLDLDLNTFKDVKLFFDNTNQLVAKVKNVDTTNKSLTFEVVNPNLLDKLKDDRLHVILAKDTPALFNARFVLKTKYIVKVGMR